MHKLVIMESFGFDLSTNWPFKSVMDFERSDGNQVQQSGGTLSWKKM